MNRTIQSALHAVGLAEHPAKMQGMRRSSAWPALRKQYLRLHPQCAVCGATKNLVVHHLEPVHRFPTLELDPLNLITLCEGPGINCHITFGHLGNWKSWNPTCLEDVDEWQEKLARRPKQ